MDYVGNRSWVLVVSSLSSPLDAVGLQGEPRIYLASSRLLLLLLVTTETWETAPAVAESPEIKLFGKWSTDDVQINDISLQVPDPGGDPAGRGGENRQKRG